MHTNPIILMVTDQAGHFDILHHALELCGAPSQARRVNNVSMALARVAGGGVQAVVVDCSGSAGEAVTPDELRGLHSAASGVRIFLWSANDQPIRSALTTVSGVSGWLMPDTSGSELKRRLFEESLSSTTGASGSSPNRSVVIAVMGAKGGLGTSAVAMNIAAGLTERGRVVIAEMRSSFGSLQGHFQPGRVVRGLASLAEGMPVSSALWPVPRVPRLKVLFGPQSVSECLHIKRGVVVDVLNQLAPEADFVVLDLAVALDEVNREAMGVSNYLAMVVEPTPICLRLGKLSIEGIQSWEKAPPSVGAVVVRRRPEGAHFTPSEIEAQLGVPVLKVIPPAPELGVVSEQAHAPMLQCDPESLVSESLLALSRCFHSSSEERHGVKRPHLSSKL